MFAAGPGRSIVTRALRRWRSDRALAPRPVAENAPKRLEKRLKSAQRCPRRSAIARQRRGSPGGELTGAARRSGSAPLRTPGTSLPCPPQHPQGVAGTDALWRTRAVATEELILHQPEPGRRVQARERRFDERTEYLVFQPSETNDAFEVRLAAGSYGVEWYNVKTRETKQEGKVRVDRDRSLSKQ